MIIFTKYPSLKILQLLLITILGFEVATSQNTPNNIDMIFWEEQSWPHISIRLTLWSDGRSEIVRDIGLWDDISNKHTLTPGWEKVLDEDSAIASFVYKNYYSKDDAIKMFNDALLAKIHWLQTHDTIYYDGGGTIVGYRKNGKLREISIPMFLDKRVTENQKRFEKVSKIMTKDFKKFKR